VSTKTTITTIKRPRIAGTKIGSGANWLNTSDEDVGVGAQGGGPPLMRQQGQRTRLGLHCPISCTTACRFLRLIK